MIRKLASWSRLLPLALWSVWVGCAGSAETKPARTQVCVLGMIHSHHVDSQVWGLDQVESTLRALKPDAVLCEIPPDRYPTAAAEFAASASIQEARVLRFPEYTGVLFPLQRELGYEIVPCAAWTRPMADARSAKLKDWVTTRAADTQRVDAAQAEAALRHRALGGKHHPEVIHTDAYDEIVREGLRPYDELFGPDLGPGGWSAINGAHWALLEAAIDARPGQRLVITFGAWHKYWFLDRLRERDDVELLDASEFLPR